MNRGFTVVELLITMVVLAILLSLGTVSFRANLANARDSERKNDVESISRGLEQFYKNGANGLSPGVYPSVNEFYYNVIVGANKWPSYAPGTSEASFTTPSKIYGLTLICIFENPSGYWSTQPGCATPGDETKIKNSLAADRYGYEPINRAGALCYGDDCASYTLYWISEVTGDLMKQKSQRQ